MSKRWSLNELVEKIINVYTFLMSQKQEGEDTIEFLKTLRSIPHLSALNMSADKIVRFFRILLDTSGIISATEGSYDSFDIGNPEHIGTKKDIRGKLSGRKEGIRDWMCSILFQGWVKNNNPNFYISKDLRYLLPKDWKACDFKISGDNVLPTLVECKRIHPERIDKSADIIKKIVKKISEAKGQFESTEEFLKEGDLYRLVILDISSYGDNSIRELDNMKIAGLQADSDIASIIKQQDAIIEKPLLKQEQISGIDGITICWSNLHYFEGYPRAFAYYTQPIRLNQKLDNNTNYQGWTIEFYPNSKHATDYSELRISPVARSRAWIKASWYSSTDNLLTFGHEELFIEHSKGEGDKGSEVDYG